MRISILDRILSRAETGFFFLEDCLEYIHKSGTDAAYSRSVYILLSYNFELVLKALIVLQREDLPDSKKTMGLKQHNLETLSKKINVDRLQMIGIKKITKSEASGFTEYIVEINNHDSLRIQDLVDVRYDFEKDVLRPVDPNESTRIKNEIVLIQNMIKIIRKFDVNKNPLTNK